MSETETFDEMEMRDHLMADLHQGINQEQENYPKAAALFRDHHEIFKKKNGSRLFRKRLKELSPEELQRYIRYGEIETLIKQAAWRKSQILKFQKSHGHDPYKIQTVLKFLELSTPEDDDPKKRLQKISDELGKILSHVDIRWTATPHPTGDLDEIVVEGEKSGVDRYIDLIDAKLQKGTNKNLIAPLLDEKNNLQPKRKSTTLDELWFVAAYALRYNNACAKMRHGLSDGFENAFKFEENGVAPPDLTHPDSRFKAALCVWQAGDYDGKPNAEQWTLMAGTTMKTYLALSHHMWRIAKADELKNSRAVDTPYAELDDLRADPIDPSQIKDPKMQKLYKTLFEIHKNAKEIFEEVEARWKYIHDPSIDDNRDERVKRYEEKKEELENLKKRLSKIYDGKKVNSAPPEKNNKGYGFYKQLRMEMHFLFRNTKAQGFSKASSELIKSNSEDLNSNGIALFKIEPRHNDKVHRQIADNLFSYPEFREFTLKNRILFEEDFSLIDRKKKFSKLTLVQQNKILTALTENYFKDHKDELRDFLFKSNTIYNKDGTVSDKNYDANGYPNQTLGVLERLEVLEIFPLTVGNFMVIAESNGSGMRLANFLKFSFGLDNLVPMPLVEDLENMRKTEEDLKHNIEHGALSEVAHRKALNLERQFKSEHLALMVARSDITRQFGPLSNVLVYKQIQKDVRQAIINKTPEMIKEGCGLSNERGGGDPMVMARLIAQEIQQCQREGIDVSDALKAMASFMSATVQGRALYKTEGEIQEQLEAQVVEMIGISMELNQELAPGTYIKQCPEFSSWMENFLNRATIECMEEYSLIRDGKGEKGSKIINDFAKMVSDFEMLKATSNGARPVSRTKKTQLTDQRAIGNNKALALTETHADGWFTVGLFLEKLHDELHKGILTKQDIEDFKKSEYWDYCLFVRSQMAAARVDFSHTFKRLKMNGKDWTHDRLMEIGKSMRFYKNAGADEDELYQMSFRDELGASEEQAYAAMLYYDAQKMMAATHALLDGKFTKEDNFDGLVDDAHPKSKKKPSAKLEFNKAAKKKWTHIDNVQKANQEARPAIELMHFMEEELKKNPKCYSDAQKRAAAAWWTKSCENQVMDINYPPYSLAHGRHQEPFSENLEEYLYVAPQVFTPYPGFEYEPEYMHLTH